MIEAERFTEQNEDRVLAFVRCNCAPGRDTAGNPVINIQTPEGVMTATLGDWVIKGVGGEFYPCKPDIFKKTYEAVRPRPAPEHGA